MIKHIVMWKFKDEAEGKTKDENMEYASSHLYALKDMIPELKGIEIGKDITHGDMSFDLALITEFENVKDLNTYSCHPDHLKVVDYIKKAIFERVTIDFEIK